MNSTTIVCFGVSTVFLTVGIVLFALSRRNSARELVEKRRGQAVIDDRDDRIIWEMGRGLPLVDSQSADKAMTRRGFVPRFVLGIFAALAGSPMARGWADALPLPKRADSVADGPAARGETDANTLIASNAPQQDHNDTHNDFETHGDNMTPHQDAYPRPGVHFDVPHYDQDTGHFDIHNDA